MFLHISCLKFEKTTVSIKKILSETARWWILWNLDLFSIYFKNILCCSPFNMLCDKHICCIHGNCSEEKHLDDDYLSYGLKLATVFIKSDFFLENDSQIIVIQKWAFDRYFLILVLLMLYEYFLTLINEANLFPIHVSRIWIHLSVQLFSWKFEE